MTKTPLLVLSLLLLSCSPETEGANNGGGSDAADMGSTDDGGDAGASEDQGADGVDQGPAAPPYDDCSVTVEPGDTPEDTYAALQNALFDVEENGVVCMVDGTYRLTQEISLDTPNAELRGQSRDGTILSFNDQDLGANGISSTSDGVVFASFTIRDTPGDAIRVTGADGVTFRDLNVTWSGGPASDNGAYGLYPVQCQNVLIEDCVVSHASDAGVYVGQSMNVIVRNNEAFGNVAGIEIENTTGADVYDNHTHDNTGGLLIFDLPGPPIQGGNSNKIHRNVIENNNQPNFAEAGNIVAQVPQGTGLLVLSSDLNEIHDNTITGNQSFAVAIVSFTSLGIPWENPDFDPYAEGNYVHDNTIDGNGTTPKGFISLVASEAGVSTMEDLLWDGDVDPDAQAPVPNCFWQNADSAGTPSTYRMFDGPGSFANQTTDIGAQECQGSELPATTL